MKLLHRSRSDEAVADDHPPPDEAPGPQPEHDEPRLEDPGPGDLSKRDYVAILKRAAKQANADHITSLAADEATPEDLLAHVRGHWRVENCSADCTYE